MVNHMYTSKLLHDKSHQITESEVGNNIYQTSLK